MKKIFKTLKAFESYRFDEEEIKPPKKETEFSKSKEDYEYRNRMSKLIKNIGENPAQEVESTEDIIIDNAERYFKDNYTYSDDVDEDDVSKFVYSELRRLGEELSSKEIDEITYKISMIMDEWLPQRRSWSSYRGDEYRGW